MDPSSICQVSLDNTRERNSKQKLQGCKQNLNDKRVKKGNVTRARTEFSHSDVMLALEALCLTSVKLGDYLVIMNAIEDTTIGGEPYIALQLWLNMMSGKVISRIWGQTVSCTTVINIDHFEDVCRKHFRYPPCLGCPFQEDELEQKTQGFVVSQTPVSRRISLGCQKVLANESKVDLQACQNCLTLMPCQWWERKTVNIQEEHINFKQEFEEPPEKVDVLDGEEDLDLKIQIEDQITESTLSPPHSPNPHSQIPASSTNLLEGGHDFSCQECGKTFSKIENLDDHKKYVHGKKRNSLTCSKCGKAFLGGSAYNLRKHWNKMHPETKLPEYVNWNLHGTSTTVAVDNPLQDNGTVPEMGPLDLECELCGTILTSNSYRSHIIRAHGKSLALAPTKNCFWCGHSVSVNHLADHAKEHHFWGKFSCREPKCNFKVDFATDLAGHINLTHKNEVEARCPQCKMGWPANDIENHYKECVTEYFKKRNEPTNKCCETCGKVFKHNKSYKGHQLIHLREKAEKGDTDKDNAILYFHCDKCDKKFDRKNNLLQHIKRLHEESSKFPCPSCGLVFKVRASLTEHERAAHSTDDRYRCKNCGKQFGNLSLLRAHKLTHEGAQFQCNYCPRKLKTEIILKLHERYHTGEKPFKCSICGNGYVSKQRLLQHQSGAHKITGPRGRKPGWKQNKK